MQNSEELRKNGYNRVEERHVARGVKYRFQKGVGINISDRNIMQSPDFWKVTSLSNGEFNQNFV